MASSDLNPLPMTPDIFLRDGVLQALLLLPPMMFKTRAEVLLVAIALQESGLAHREQVDGPACGVMQFEAGGVSGVLQNPRTRAYAIDLCYRRIVDATTERVLAALKRDDVLAAGFGRLLLWTDPHPLPEMGDADGAWDTYKRNWRPGKPHPRAWARNYKAALAAVEARHGG